MQSIPVSVWADLWAHSGIYRKAVQVGLLFSFHHKETEEQMKRNIFYTVLSIVICTCLLISQAYAIPPITSLSITLSYSDFTHPLEDFTANQFALQNSQGQYLIAETDAQGGFHYVGWIDDKASSTSLCTNPVIANTISIFGLPAGTYNLTQLTSIDGYNLLHSSQIILEEGEQKQIRVILTPVMELPSLNSLRGIQIFAVTCAILVLIWALPLKQMWRKRKTPPM